MRRSGFTTIELVIAIVLIGLIAAIGFPKIHRTLDKTNVRSARVALSTYVAMARAAAIQRGCPGVVHFAYGTSSRMWVTACKLGVPTAIDTIGQVKELYSDFNVTLSATRDSVRYDPRGLSYETVNTVVHFTGNVESNTDSVVINLYTGKVVR